MEPAASGPLAAYRVLIVDDDPEVSALLVRFLRARGVDTEVAQDGETAWQQFLRWPPDGVILDLALPKVRGEELVQRIRQHLTCSRVPVVIVSGTLRRPQDEAELLTRVKADAAFRKPFPVAEVVQKLEEHVAVYLRRRPAAIAARTDSGRVAPAPRTPTAPPRGPSSARMPAVPPREPSSVRMPAVPTREPSSARMPAVPPRMPSAGRMPAVASSTEGPRSASHGRLASVPPPPAASMWGSAGSAPATPVRVPVAEAPPPPPPPPPPQAIPQEPPAPQPSVHVASPPSRVASEVATPRRPLGDGPFVETVARVILPSVLRVPGPPPPQAVPDLPLDALSPVEVPPVPPAAAPEAPGAPAAPPPVARAAPAADTVNAVAILPLRTPPAPTGAASLRALCAATMYIHEQRLDVVLCIHDRTHERQLAFFRGALVRVTSSEPGDGVPPLPPVGDVVPPGNAVVAQRLMEADPVRFLETAQQVMGTPASAALEALEHQAWRVAVRAVRTGAGTFQVGGWDENPLLMGRFRLDPVEVVMRACLECAPVDAAGLLPAVLPALVATPELPARLAVLLRLRPESSVARLLGTGDDVASVAAHLLETAPAGLQELLALALVHGVGAPGPVQPVPEALIQGGRPWRDAVSPELLERREEIAQEWLRTTGRSAYAVLGVPPAATLEALHQAAAGLRERHGPPGLDGVDLGPARPYLELLRARREEALRLLQEPSLRAAYDAWMAAAMGAGGVRPG